MRHSSRSTADRKETAMFRGRTKPVRLLPAYIVGLVDGEGCFSVRFNDSKRRRAKVDMGFSVKLKSEDRQILARLQDYFGCGGIYIQRDRRPRHRLCYRYEVTAKVELQRIILPFFSRHPLQTPTKQKDVRIFARVLLKVLRKEHLTERGTKSIATLVRNMH